MLVSVPTTSRRKIRPIAVYSPLPWQVPVWRDYTPTVLLTGSAGGGKSRVAAEKIHAFCLRYPGATGLMLRKTRQSMTNSTTLFVERQVIGKDKRVTHFPSKHRFEYWNGSILAYGGMADDEQREQVRGIGQDSGVDICWMEEATQFDESDYNELLARMRAKAAPWRQMLLTTNPDAPTHWIFSRLIQGGEARVYYSKALDNPHNPEDYQATLAKLTGVERDRLVGGQWIQASGLVFDVWLDGPDGGNVTEAAEYEPGAGSILWLVDDGYAGQADANTGMYTADSHPRAILLVQQKPDGHLDIFAESYAVKKLSNVHIGEVKAMAYPEPEYAIRGPGSAEIAGQLFAQGVYSRQVTEDVEETIKTARNFIAADENGIRRVRVHPRCRHLRAEFASYRRDPVSGKVIKQHDHGVDSVRYMCWTLRHG